MGATISAANVKCDGSDSLIEASRAYQWWEPNEAPTPPWRSDHFTIETRFNLSSMADGASNSDRLGVDLFSDDFANWRGVWIDLVDAPQLGKPRALGVAASGFPPLRVTVPLDEFEVDTDYILKWEVEIGVVMRAELWKAEDPEPDWQVSIADPETRLSRGPTGEIMLFTIMQTGIDQTKRFEYLDVRDAGG